MEIRIRPASAADVEALVALLGELFSIERDFRPDPARQRSGLALMLADAARRGVFAAERAGAVVGMVTAQLLVSTAEGAPSVVVEDLIVERRARGCGVGRALLRAVEGWARQRGATRLQLLADRENAPALAFYEATGWSGTQLVCLRRRGD
jgi:ribosomal protein S18 acetylase RimI-like enzyme